MPEFTWFARVNSMNKQSSDFACDSPAVRLTNS